MHVTARTSEERAGTCDQEGGGGTSEVGGGAELCV